MKSKGRPKVTANRFIIDQVGDMDGDGEFNLKDVIKQLKENKHNEWSPLEGDGDFRSDECVNLLRQSDIVITNPPFSLFREYVKQLFEYKKKFVIIGTINAITYKEIFPLIKNNKLWLGVSMDGRNKWFQVPDDYPINENVANSKIENRKKFLFVKGCVWFTNLDHGRRHEPLPLMNKADIIKFSTKRSFEKYDNYDAIEVSLVKNIPSDYKGVMGVPISFLNKYNPDQFEIIGITKTWFGGARKTYPPQIQINANGKRSEVTKLNDGATLRLDSPPTGQTYYVVGDGYYIQLYARVLIKHKDPKI